MPGYAPTNEAKDEDKEAFYHQLQTVYNRTPRRDVTLVMGDFNAKIGSDNANRETVMGKYGLGSMNEKGEIFSDFCVSNELIIGGTIFPHKQCHKVTWRSPNARTENQIDHVTIVRRWRSTLQDVRAKRGADVGSDHHLLVAQLKLKLAAVRKAKNPRRRYDVGKLKMDDLRHEFQLKLQNRFELLAPSLREEDGDVNEDWKGFKEMYTNTCEVVLGKVERKRKEWLTDNTWQMIYERRQLKADVDKARTRLEKRNAMLQYSIKGRQVKAACRRDKRAYINQLATDAEEAARKGDLKRLYQTTRLLSGRKPNLSKPIRNRDGIILAKLDEKLARWKEHFEEVLNRPLPNNPPNLQQGSQLPERQIKSPRLKLSQLLKASKLGRWLEWTTSPQKPFVWVVRYQSKHFTAFSTKSGGRRKSQMNREKDFSKKGDTTYCKNWKGITLLATASKVLSKIILDRMKAALDSLLRDEQAGFRQERSCTDQIATLRIIIEQSLEWNTGLYLGFVDFEKAFDSVDREVIWQILWHYGVPEKIVNMIRCFYSGFECQAIHDGFLTEPFQVRTGVRQGCLLSPLLFLVVLDWVTREAYGAGRTGIQWSFTRKLEDRYFADDLCLMSQKLQHMQEKVEALQHAAERVGLKINNEKTQEMRIQARDDSPIHIGDEVIQRTDHFTYLGSVVSESGGTEEDIVARIRKAQQAFATLRSVWKSRGISLNTKLRIFNSNIKSVLLYGSETWRLTKALLSNVQSFLNKRLRQIIGIFWPNVITNEELWARTGQEDVETTIKRRKWRWIGHTLRKAPNNTTRMAMEWNPQGRRSRGRPKQSWRRTVSKELENIGRTWGEAKLLANNKIRWKAMVEALCLSRG